MSSRKRTLAGMKVARARGRVGGRRRPTMATRYKDRITILEDAEIEELYGRPRFTHDERVPTGRRDQASEPGVDCR
jgi:hypothetical protein